MFTVETATAHWVKSAKVYHAAALSLVASAALVYFTDTKSTLAQITANLIAAVSLPAGEEGPALGRSSTFRYVGLARQLAARLRKAFPAEEGKGHGGIIGEVLDARSPETAVKALIAYLADEGVATVEALSFYLGLYKRSKAQTRPTEGAGTPEPATPRRVSPERIVATVGASTPAAFLDLMRDLAANVNDVQVCRNVLAIWEDRIEELDAEKPARRPRRAVTKEEDGHSTHPGSHHE